MPDNRKQNYRIIDANFNRAREALRVLEEFCRFILNDAVLSERSKRLRHDLCHVMSQLPAVELITFRDTPGDVGCGITTSSETTRKDSGEVIVAAGKRLSEALRCIEEFGKVVSPDMAGAVESLRYKAYDIEQAIILRANPRVKLGKVRLYVLVTAELCHLSLPDTVQAVIAGGADCIQLRQKGVSDRELFKQAVELAGLCRQAGVLFVMNDRVDLALLAGADGVHLGQGDLGINEARKVMGAHMFAGSSCHSMQEVQQALEQGADYVAIGAVYGSNTKPDVQQVGLGLIQNAREICPANCPVIAIGGIDTSNVRAVLEAGANGVALCSAIISQPDPEQATQKFAEIINNSQ